MKKNKLKSKKTNKTISRISTYNTLNENKLYDILENNINKPYTNSILEENNVPSEEIGTLLPQDNNIQNTNTPQNNIPTENEDYEADEYNLPEQGPGPVIVPYNPLQQGPGPVIPPYFPPQQGPGPVIQPYFPPQQGPGPVIPPGQKMPNVKIKSVYTNTFIISGYKNILYAVGTNYNQGEVFRIIPITSAHVIVRVVGEGFIRINNQGTLIADTNRDKASRFIMFRQGSMIFALLAPNGRFVEVRSRDNMLVARGTYASARSLFRFRQVNP